MEEPIIIKFPISYTYDEIDELKNSSVDILIFDIDFRGDLCNFEFPDTIFYLEINFDCELSGVNLPKYLKKLKFGIGFNHLLNNVELPDTLEILEFNNYSNSLFSVKLPKSLKKIINKSHIIDQFVQEFSLYSLPFFLPPDINEINLGSRYNYKSNAFVFPKNLKKLAISGNANNKIIFYEMYEELKTLNSLEILDKLEFPINKLPENIKKIKLPFDYNNWKTPINLPLGLEHLTISGTICNKSMINNLPPEIKSLSIINTLDFEFGILPISLSEMYLNFAPDKKLTMEIKDKKIINFQSSIKKIIFSDNFDCSQVIVKLPSDLEYLKISGSKCNEFLINNLPENLLSVEIVNDLEFELSNLPLGLRDLYINVFNKQIMIEQTNLPNCLETIKLFKSYPDIYFKKPFNCVLTVLND
jgi:hypothetical protein